MNLNVKRLGYGAAVRLGIHRLPGLFFGDFITIITYHGVVPKPLNFYDWCFIDEDQFESQMRYLKKHFDIIHLSGINQRMCSTEKGRPAAVITFDDGYQNNYDVAFPILKKEGIPATIFLSTGFIDTSDTIWSCRLHNAFAETSKTEFNWDGTRFDIKEERVKLAALASIKLKLKKMAYNQTISSMKEIVVSLGVDPGEEIDPQSPYRMLNQKSINAMKSSGLIDFGAHTHSHSILSRLSSGEQEAEIKRSIEVVSNITGVPCRLFAYPNGRSEDYDNDTVKILRDNGIAIAVTTMDTCNDGRTSLLELKRYGVGADTCLANFKLMVHHTIPFIKSFVRGSAYGY